MENTTTETGDHIFAIYDGIHEIESALDFLKEGLEKNESCMLITDRISKETIRGIISKKWNVDELESNRSVIVKKPQEILFPDGSFHTRKGSGIWKDLTDIVIQNGKAGLRIFIDVSAMFKASLEKKVITFESSLEKKFDFPCTIVCAYTPEDIKKVGTVGLQALREHHNVHWNDIKKNSSFTTQKRVKKCKTCGREFETYSDELCCSIRCRFAIE